MYAVIRSGGKQYRVEPGATIEMERLDGKVGGKVRGICNGTQKRWRVIR